MATGPTAIRSNPVPPGGQTAQQPVPPSMTPDDIKALVEHLLSGVSARFREASTKQYVKLLDQSLSLGQTQAAIPIINVGLGAFTTTHFTAVLNIVNTIASTQVITLGRYFPWNLIVDNTVAINGGGEVYSTTGVGDLVVMMRNRQGVRSNTSVYGTNTGLGAGLVRITLGANLSAQTFSGLNLSGTLTVTVAASSTGVLTADWYTKEKFVFSEDTLLGTLPLQNNQTSAILMRSVTGQLGPTVNNQNIFPFATFISGVTYTLVSLTAKTQYCFWSLPSDPGLYADLVSNAFKVQESRQNNFNATGPNALTYNVPQNEYVTAMHFIAYDGGNNYLVPLTAYNGFLQLVYAGGNLRPVNHLFDHILFEQQLRYIDYMGDMPGYFLWDGNDTAEEITSSDDSGWLDSYLAGQPQVTMDIAAGQVLPINFNVVRESVVPGAVVQVGG